MTDFLRTEQLLARGYDKGELAQMVRRGALVHLRHGTYAFAGDGDEPKSTEAEHGRLARAASRRLLPGTVVSHGSAAVLHGLPVWPTAITRVHATRSRVGGAKRRSDVEVHGAALPPRQVILLSGVPVTSLARTVADLGRTLPFAQAVAAGDRAVALGLDFGDLDEVLESMAQWPGVRQARRLAGFLDGRSESVGESVSRVRLWEQGLPIPVLQREIYDRHGTLIARVDFAWELQRTVGEFDGKVKYGALLKPGQRPEEVLFLEKQREDALRDEGWQMARWVWSDLDRHGVLRDRVLRAFARNR